MPSQKIDASQLDYHYSNECPACSDEAGWTGETEFRKDGTLGLRFACPHCFNQFVTFWTGYNKEFAAVPKPAFTAGRDVPVRFIRQ